MKIRGRVKWIITAAATCGLLALVLFSGYGLTAGKRQEFPLDGYILEVTASEEGAVCTQRGFAAGTKAREKFPDSWQYKDTEGHSYAASKESFLHFEDGSFSAFSGGALVDMAESGTSVLEFYHIEPMMIMAKSGEGWTIDNNSKNLEFKELLWALNREHLMAASDKLELTLSNGEKKTISGYLELMWLDEGIIRLTDGEEIWQTLASGTRIRYSSGMTVDLGEKLVQDREGNAVFSMEALSADQDLAIDLQSDSSDWSGWTPPTFVVHNDDGADGESGAQGEQGEEGEQGKEGEKGDNGKNGEGGAVGGRAGGVISGEETNLADESMARVLITDVSGSGTDISFAIKVKDPGHTLVADTGVISVREAQSGVVVWKQNIDLTSVDTQSFRIHDGSLKEDMQYSINVESGYQINMENGITNTGSMTYVIRDFYTASEGLCLDRVDLTQENMTVYLGKTGNTAIKSVYLKVKTQGGEYEYETGKFDPGTKKSYTIEYQAEIAEKWGFDSVEGITNQPFSVELYMDTGNGQYVKSPYELKGTFLKKEPVFTGLSVIRKDGYYEFREALASDPDQALEGCRFVITDHGTEIKTLTSPGSSVQWYYDTGLCGKEYTVTVYMTWNDNRITVEKKLNTKLFTLPSNERFQAKWTDSTSVHGSAIIAGTVELKADAPYSIPENQVVTVTLAKPDGSWKKTSYLNLKDYKKVKGWIQLPLKYTTDLEEDAFYTLTVRGRLTEIVEGANGYDMEQDTVEILFREKIKTRSN